MIFVLPFCIVYPAFRILRWQYGIVNSFEWKLDITLMFLEKQTHEIEFKGRMIRGNSFSMFFENFFPDKQERQLLIRWLRADGYATKEDPIQITDDGIRLRYNGGYSRMLQNRKREDSKLKYESKMAKWQYMVFWPLFAIAIAGFIMSIIALVRDKG